MTIWQPKDQDLQDKIKQPNFGQKVLGGVSNVFDWIKTNVEEPFGAIVTSPFSPRTQGTEGMNWLEREKQEYQNWQAPTIHTGVDLPNWLGGNELTLGVKGAVEQVPWLLPTLASGGYAALAKGAQAGSVAAKVGRAALKPLVVANNVMDLPAKKSLEWLSGMMKGAKKAQNILTPIRKAEKGVRIGAYEEQLGRATGLKGSLEATAALKGEYTRPKYEFTTKLPEPTPEELTTHIDNIANAIRDLDVPTWEKPTMFDALQKIMLKEVPQPAQIDKIERYLSPELANTLREIGKSIPQKAFDTTIDAMNGSRSLLTSFDISALGRQGLLGLLRHPTEIPSAVKNTVKALFSEKQAGLIDDMIKNDPLIKEAGKNGWDIGLTVRGGKNYGEENFMSRLAEKIPGIKQSERSYVTGLNYIRYKTFKQGYELLSKVGATESDFSELARLTRVITGRGDLPSLFKGSSPVLNAMLFSPKLLFSRLQFPTLLFSPSKLVRGEAWMTLRNFLAFGTGVLGLAKAAGAKIGTDPRAADFGKIKIGDTQLDIWTGYIQYARFLAQLTTGQKVTQGGNAVEANRLETIARFLQSKTSPAAGLLVDLLRGETYMGEDIYKAENVPSQIYTRLAPLAIQDLISALNEEGFPNGLIALPGFTGVGVVTYEDRVKQAREKAAVKKYGIGWDEVGTKYTAKAQRELERTDLKLAEAMKDAEEKSEGSVWANWKNEGKEIEGVYQNAVSLAAKEYQQTQDGVIFREKVSDAALVRREMYNLRDLKKEYKSIAKIMNKPISEEDKKDMNPLDIARNEYYQLMYSEDMTDEFGNYNFDKAEEVRNYISQKYGQEALQYVEDYMGVKWDAPNEFNELQVAKKVLKPYWAVQNQVENMFGVTYANSKGGQRLIQKTRQNMRKTNPIMEKYYQAFYSTQA
jgi:hypothetical protein